MKPLEIGPLFSTSNIHVWTESMGSDAALPPSPFPYRASVFSPTMDV